MNSLPTPISVLEGYFGEKLTVKDMSYWAEVSDDTWVDFAKTYLAQIETGFTAQAMADRIEGQKIRLYFDYKFGEDYDRAIDGRYAKTPLLGISPYPAKDVDYRGEGLVQALGPLTKHLLVSDELYLMDSFYRCFDVVADQFSRNHWRDDPNVEGHVHMSIAAIRRWLLILAGLRDLITSGVINFIPYYVLPSFIQQFGSSEARRTDLKNRQQFAGGVDIPDPPGFTPLGEGEPVKLDLSKIGKQNLIPPPPNEPRLDTSAALKAWVDARLLGVDPVFPNEITWRWASGIKFHDETKMQATSDLMSIDILPLGGEKGLSPKDIVSMRKGEESFQHVRDTLIGCEDHVRKNVSETASSEFFKTTCRDYIRDTLDPRERFKTIKFLDNNLTVGTAFNVAIGALFVGANPFVALAAGAALTPKVFLKTAGAIDPKIRAAVRLEALL